jgi:RNA polymerase sigma-70 factor (ECF subfamily)
MPGLDSTNRTLEEYRKYLETLTFIQVSPRLRRKFGRSDIISKTLWEAYQRLDQIRELDEEGRKRYLRRMLIHNLLEAINHYKASCRDPQAELYLDADASSNRLESWLASEEPAPWEKAATNEDALRLLEAISRLPDRQQEALILQRYHGLKLKEIAEQMNCTMGAVAGLHANGLKNLKKLLSESE